MTSLAYALTLTLTNKSAIDLRIWKGYWFRISFNWDVIWDNDVSGCRFESWRWSESIIYIDSNQRPPTSLSQIMVLFRVKMCMCFYLVAWWIWIKFVHHLHWILYQMNAKHSMHKSSAPDPRFAYKKLISDPLI